MDATVPIGSGLPVAIGEIDHELKKLWEQSGEIATRASLINLAICCEGRDAMADNTELIGSITENRACRALLVCLDSAAPQGRVQAWIGAHCHLSRAGAKQVCSEQITFLLEGESRKLMSSIVFSHLDSDLPLYLWWQGEFPDPLDCQLWKWVDRLIFDSNAWCQKSQQFTLLDDSLVQSQSRLTLCDLNWSRSLFLRQATATTFDHPEVLPLLAQIDRVTIRHAPGYRCTSMLVAGWLATQLDWTGMKADGRDLHFESPAGRRVTVAFQNQPGEDLSELVIDSGRGTVRIHRDAGSDFLKSEVTLPNGRQSMNLYPAGRKGLAALVGEELMRGGHHRIYLRALGVVKGSF